MLINQSTTDFYVIEENFFSFLNQVNNNGLQ